MALSASAPAGASTAGSAWRTGRIRPVVRFAECPAATGRPVARSPGPTIAAGSMDNGRSRIEPTASHQSIPVIVSISWPVRTKPRLEYEKPVPGGCTRCRARQWSSRYRRGVAVDTSSASGPAGSPAVWLSTWRRVS